MQAHKASLFFCEAEDKEFGILFFKTKDGALLHLFSNSCFLSLKGHRMAPLTMKNSFTEHLHHEMWTN